MTENERDTMQPPAPPSDWRQELNSALAEVQDRAGEMMHLFSRMYAHAASFGASLLRLGEAITRIPPE